MPGNAGKAALTRSKIVRQILMRNRKINIGTSGWSYKHWKGRFYPEKMAPVDYLTYYAAHFRATELNASFYHLPERSTVKHWVEKVPVSFRFCPKISRYITHIKRLKDPAETLPRFFHPFQPMKIIMGPVLVQLPPTLKFEPGVTENFYKILKRRYAAYSFAVEVRHETWLSDESINLMRANNIAFVISQSGDVFPYAEAVTANNIYVRFHGPGALFASSYTESMLQDFAAKFRLWAAKGHHVWAFFNNDIGLHAIHNAERLKELTGS